MEKLLKSSLSLLIVICFLSCKNEENKRTLAEKRYKEANFFPQGSIPFQNGIAEAITIDSTYVEAVYELSVAYLKRGVPHKWKSQYDKAVKIDSINKIPLRGYLYLWFYRDYKKAIKNFDKSDLLTPNFIDAPRGLSVDCWHRIAYLGLKNYEKSIFYFDKYIKKEIEDFSESSVNINTFLFKGIAFLELGEPEKAENSFNRLLKNSYNLSADAKYYKALIFKKQGKIEEAKAILDTAFKDFNDGYNNKRPYVETLRQLYIGDLNELKLSLNFK